MSGPAAPAALSSRLRVLAYTSLGHFINDGTSLFVPVVAALLATGHGMNTVDLAILFLVYYAASSLLSPYVGRLADVGGHPARLLAAGLVLLGAGLSVFYLALTFPSAALGLSLSAGFLTGFGSAFYHPLGATLLQQSFGPAERGKALGINGAVGSTGRALYPVIFFLIGLAVSSSDSLVVFALFAVAGGMVVLSVSREAGGHAARRSEGPLSLRSTVTRGIALLAVVAFVRSTASQGIIAWMPTYLSYHPILGGSLNLGLEVAILYVAGILGQPIFGVLVDRFDRRGLLALSSVGTALSTVGFLLTGGALPVLFLLLIGFFTFSAFPMLMSLTPDYLPSGASTLANSIVFGLGTGIGGALGPFLVGLLAYGGYSHIPFALEVMAALGIFAAATVVILPRPGRGGRLPLFG